jgi:outer membrane protein assembly factor BamB
MKSRTLLPILVIGLAALLVGGCGKPPLVPDAPKGPAKWLQGIAYACTTTTTDPTGVQVAYQFDWGDGTKSQWSQFMNGGTVYTDTHAYAQTGQFSIKVRAKNTKKASAWSDPLDITAIPGEGAVVWEMFFTDPFETEEPDSAEFDVNSFAIGPNGTPYITSTNIGATIALKPSGATAWAFYRDDPYSDEFFASPVVADDGTILVGCSNDFVYALNPDGTVKWADSVGSSVSSTGALGANGTAYFQTEDSTVIALRSDGTQLWSFFTGGGNSSPVVGTDGTVYATNQDGIVYALDPDSGSQKWTSILGSPVIQAPAIDPTRNVLYVVTDAGLLQTIDLSNGGALWSYLAGADASGPAIGTDGTIYVGGEGKLTAVNPDGSGMAKWVFTPAMAGVVSTPAITVDGYIYVLVVAGKKRLALQGTDSLYAVNSDGTLRWACGLGEGQSDPDYPLSAPKIDAGGFIYVGDGNRAWCVAGLSAPAQSIWPTIHHDAQNTGRAR